ncbi:MAG: 16S rRNA (guanine(966)-N(2))-methyltransferase RsmD, partial [Gammaproteobacteria bacterium]|nr:16S rRNA (guanine(966)-N(2))-methyltransferase RsmD [Gammaproteobacteria bacterium]
FEALSRGAGKVIFVERDARVYQSLRVNLDLLKLESKSEINQSDAMNFISGLSPETLDLVFLDPPYGKGLVSECLKKLYDCQCLKPKGLLYLEQESELCDPELPEGWIMLKNKQAGQVNYYLLQASQVEK